MRCMCDVCAAHGDRAAVDVDVKFCFITAEKGGAGEGEKEKVTLVTLVSHSQLRWQGVTQSGVAPVFPFRAHPYCADAGAMRYLLCNAAPQ